MSDYNYSNFSTSDYDFNSFDGPALGAKAPNAELATLAGDTVNLLDFSGDFLVLEMGSITCPLFQSRRGTMSDLVKFFPDVSHAILYVREAHPGEKIKKHAQLGDKIDNARRLQKSDGEQRQILIDSLEGPTHAAYGSRPNSVFIINKNGCVMFHSDWNNPSATTRALKLLKAGKSAAHVKSYFRPALPPIALRTFKHGGKGSAADFFAGLPKLIWTNIFKRNFSLMFNRGPAVLPDARC